MLLPPDMEPAAVLPPIFPLSPPELPEFIILPGAVCVAGGFGLVPIVVFADVDVDCANAAPATRNETETSDEMRGIVNIVESSSCTSSIVDSSSRFSRLQFQFAECPGDLRGEGHLLSGPWMTETEEPGVEA